MNRERTVPKLWKSMKVIYANNIEELKKNEFKRRYSS